MNNTFTSMLCKVLVITFNVISVLLISLVAFLPSTNFLGFDFEIQPRAYTNVKLPESFSGALLANQWLSEADHLFVNEIFGPESFASYNGKVYTGLNDGRILELLGDRYHTVAQLDPNQVGAGQCAKPWLTAGQCARPLGLRFDTHGMLYAIDPFHGIFRVNVNTGANELVYDIQAHRLKPRFLDDFVIVNTAAGDMEFYMTDASTRWSLYDANLVVTEHERTGRLLSYNVRTKELRVRYQELSFPNGLALTDAGDAILMNVLGERRVVKYHLTGKNVGKITDWATNLPGEPDNIKRSTVTETETYWVALFTGRSKHRPHLVLDTLEQYPFVTRFGIRLARLIGYSFQSIGALVRCECMQKLGFQIKALIVTEQCTYGMAVELNANGEVINSLHSPDGKTCALTEVFELPPTATHRNFLLGSLQSHLGRISVPKDALNSVQSSVKQQSEQPPKQQPPKQPPKQQQQPKRPETAQQPQKPETVVNVLPPRQQQPPKQQPEHPEL